MQTGTKISAFMHLGAIGLALFGGVLFRADPTEPFSASDVSLISSEEFAALQSRAPEPTPEATVAPEINEPNPVEETAPELKTQEQPEPSPELAQPDEEVAIAAPEPTPAPRIDTESAPKPAPDAKEAETAQEEVTQEEGGTTEAAPQEAQAPKEAATQIVTEADAPSEYAPTTSSVPRVRPSDIKERVAKANTSEPTDEPVTEEPVVDNTAEEIAKALAEATKDAETSSQPDVPKGPPLTGGEREGLILAVQKCWNVPIGIQNAADLAVTIEIELGPDGRLIGGPKLIEPSSAQSDGIKQAFEAGRRALIRCAPYDLPKEKYEQWRQIEVVFNPENMVLR